MAQTRPVVPARPTEAVQMRERVEKTADAQVVDQVRQAELRGVGKQTGLIARAIIRSSLVPRAEVSLGTAWALLEHESLHSLVG